MTSIDLLQPGLNGAFVADGFASLPVPVAQTGASLQGKRLAVKDVFEIEGLRTGAGNPRWRDAQPLATRTALPVRLLLAQGAQWVGKTVTDELTYSLAGINVHYGTPVNPADPARIPGGSSSGSAVAVAAGHADIGIGTDCGGSIRLPASYCGVWGMRPTHGRIPADDCLTLAHSFDTVGWFARDAQTLIDTFEVLAHGTVPLTSERCALQVPEELLACVDAPARARFMQVLDSLASLDSLGFAHSGIAMMPMHGALSEWARAFRVLQAGEIAQRHGAWAKRHADSLGADVRGRFDASRDVTQADVSAAQGTRIDAIRRVARAFDEPGVYWIIPTVPGTAPRADASREAVDEERARAQQMLCVAGLAGLPQVSMPWTTFGGAPLGISIVGARGDDEGVLSVARAVQIALERVA